MKTLFISCSPRMTGTFASLGTLCLFFCNLVLEEDFLWSLVYFLFRSTWSFFVSRATSSKWQQILSGKSNILLTVLVSCQKYLEQDWCQRAGKQRWCFVRQTEWSLVRICGFVLLVADGSFVILVHGAGLSNKQLVMLLWDSSRIMSIKHVTVAGKQACFPVPVCSNICCGWFQVSFPNQ